MGWGQGVFPIFTQLNVLTNANHIDDTNTFFVNTYGKDGKGYTVGDLCYDWEPTKAPSPPWPTVPPNWDAATASEWKNHCQNDLNVPNVGLDHDGSETGNTVKEDVTNWIREAILAKQRIIYQFLRDDDGGWKADRWKAGENRWRIRVTGPGF